MRCKCGADFFAFHAVDVVPGVSLQIGSEVFGETLLVGFVQHPLKTLQDFHQQLHPPHLADVAGNLKAVHTLFAGLHLVGGHLHIGHLLEGLVQQVLSALLHVAAEPLTEVVQSAQFEVALAQLAVAQGIAHLDVVTEVVVQLLIRPAVGRFEEFQPHQHVDWHVRARRTIGVHDRKRRFVQTTEELPVEDARPGFLQAFAQFFRQVVDVAGQRNLAVSMVFLEHGQASLVGVALIILNFAPFEEGAIWIRFVRSFLQESHP